MNVRLGTLIVTLAAAGPAAGQYALPFQLRPVTAGNAVRSDTALAVISPASEGTGTTVATTLLASYQVAPDLAPFARLALVRHAPAAGQGGVALVNPILGAAYSRKLADGLRAGAIFAVSVPVGMGGGDGADPANVAAARAGVLARSAMDNALFAVNDVVLIPGAGLALTSGRFTVQVEATVLQLIRVRGAAAQPDAARTNFTSGLHLGCFLLPELSLGLELRYQRWLSTPVAVTADERLRDTLTAAAGVRAHFKLGDRVWLRPALVYARPLDNPMSGQGYQVVQLDLPLAF